MVLWLVLKLRRRFIAAARQIKRLEGISRSPLFSLLAFSLRGLPSIRSIPGLRDRTRAQFREAVDVNTSNVFLFLVASRWLGLRLDLSAACFLGVASLMFVLLRDFVDAGLVGFGLSSVMTLVGVFQVSLSITRTLSLQDV